MFGSLVVVWNMLVVRGLEEEEELRIGLDVLFWVGQTIVHYVI